MTLIKNEKDFGNLVSELQGNSAYQYFSEN